MEKHFKEGTLLGKLFNRNTVKIGYARTSNMKEIITGQNIKLLNPKPPPPPIPPPPPTIVIQPPSSVLDPVQSQDSIAEEASTATNKRCSCERRRKVCPVDGSCDSSDVVYSSLVSSSKGNRTYLGSCSTSFRLRYNNHTSDSNLIHRRENTTLADHKWSLKERNIHPELEIGSLFKKLHARVWLLRLVFDRKVYDKQVS